MNLNRNGVIGTAIFHLLIAFLLIFFGFSFPDPPPEEEGVLVNFGTEEFGSGNIEPSGDETQGGTVETTPVTETSTETVPEVKPVNSSPKEKVPEKAQTYEESPVKEIKPTAEEIRKQKEERERLEALQKQKAEEEKKRQQAEKLQKMGESAFGNKGIGTEQGSEGITTGPGNQGSMGGQAGAENYGPGGGLGNGISYGLGSRKSRGDLPKPLLSACVITSRIVIKVQIDVDPQGNVIGTPMVMEATYQDECLYNAVIRAAMQSKFSVSETAKQRGWIKYILEP